MDLNSLRSLKEIFDQALLAQASYADLTGVGFENDDLLELLAGRRKKPLQPYG